VRIFSVELATNDTYFLVSRPKDAEKPEVKAITHWARAQFGNHWSRGSGDVPSGDPHN
jgi:hypothetical protein